MAAYSDRSVGLVLTRLQELGLDRNTVVILVSDHGDTMGRHRMVSKDFAFYEPAMRIPMVKGRELTPRDGPTSPLMCASGWTTPVSLLTAWTSARI